MDFYIAFQCGFNPSSFCILRVRYCLFFGIRTGDASRQVWKRSHISAVLDIRGKYHFVRKRIIEISIITMLLNKSGKCLAGQGVAPTVYRQFAQYPQNSKPAFLHYALVCMPKAHHICSCVRSPYRFLKFNAATKQPNAPFTLQHIRSAFSHKNL